MSMPRPLAAAAPRDLAASTSGVWAGWYTRSTTSWPGPRSAGSQGIEKAGTVGVVADQLAAMADDGVDRAQGLGHACEAVERRDHVSFVRHRHRQAFEAEGAHGVDRLGPAAGRHLEGDEEPVEPE